MAVTLNASSTAGFVTTADTSTILQLQTNGTTAVTVDDSQRVGVGTTSPSRLLHLNSSLPILQFTNPTTGTTANDGTLLYQSGANFTLEQQDSGYINVFTGGSERARIDSSGNLLVGKTSTGYNVVGGQIRATGTGIFTVDGGDVGGFNRLTSDGTLVAFFQDTTQEGSISVSGTTVSYNGGHLARFTQFTTNVKDEALLKGTVLSNLDEMCVYVNEETGETADNEQLNKTKVSDVEGDVNVAGVFVAWIHDEQHNVDEINMAMTGDMIIRIAQGTTVQRGDLLMSAGDGTAKPQGDDIVRSKTVAKVTSTHVTCTYADGSYCVPCVLMAC